MSVAMPEETVSDSKVFFAHRVYSWDDSAGDRIGVFRERTGGQELNGLSLPWFHSRALAHSG